jgi:hypothetical protein
LFSKTTDRMKIQTFSAACLLSLACLLTACTNDELPAPNPETACDTLSINTYDNGVKAIIEKTCAYAGCHDGSSGIGPGDYTSYQGLLPYLNNGSIFNRVVEQAGNPAIGMPPNKSIYEESKQDDLTPEELEIMRCWLLSGFPEN